MWYSFGGKIEKPHTFSLLRAVAIILLSTFLMHKLLTATSFLTGYNLFSHSGGMTVDQLSIIPSRGEILIPEFVWRHENPTIQKVINFKKSQPPAEAFILFLRLTMEELIPTQWLIAYWHVRIWCILIYIPPVLENLHIEFWTHIFSWDMIFVNIIHRVSYPYAIPGRAAKC